MIVNFSWKSASANNARFAASRWWRLFADGVGLACMEFVITNSIRIHPMALVYFDRLHDKGRWWSAYGD
ncbi:hypothetical protein C6558_38410 [Ensifer sp. NM-2]|nr:hypothetical protein C6558_38410 [Ensifer sp. NM-2]